MRYQISGKQIDVGEALQTHVKAELGEVVEKYAQRPMHFFGRFGLWSILLSVVTFTLMLFYKYLYDPPKTFIETPLPALTVMFFGGGVLAILMGLQAEMVMRTYYESQAKTTYLLGEVRQGKRTPL